MEHARSATVARSWLGNQPRLLWPGWFLLVVLIVAAWMPALRDNFESLAHPPPEAGPALTSADVTAGAHAVYHLVLDALFGLAAIAEAAWILGRQRADPLAVASAFALTLWGVANGLAVESMADGVWWEWLVCCTSWVAVLALSVYSLRVSRQSPTVRRRQQIRWLWYGAAVTLVLMAAVASTVGTGAILAPDEIDRHMTGHLLLVLAGSVLPAALAAAWLAPAVPDPDTLIRRTMVYGALTSFVMIAGIFLVLLPAFLYPVLAPVYLLAVVSTWAVAGLPLQRVVQRNVNRLLYGQRDEPMTVLAHLAERLELGTPETVLTAIVETVATTLKLPAVAIRDGETDEVLASIGQSDLEPFVLPIVHQGHQVARLVAFPRARDEALHERDIEILWLVARQSGPTAHAVQLNQELRRSRQQVVSSREEERRRIRRDLHDGLGPALAAIAMQADTARAVVDENPNAAREIMAAVTDQARGVVDEVRRLVYELRPPALDELGLSGAIARLARQGTSATLRVDFTAPAALPAFDAAIEVAAYRIVAEALNNVARHAGATRCTIAIELAHEGVLGALSVTIDDDGVGIPATPTPGIGLRSMRDRASEVGGTVLVQPRPEGGTRVLLTMPQSRWDRGVAPGGERGSASE